MTCYIAPEAASDLDDIWYYVATESGRAELADKLVDAITDRFHLLATHPHVGRRRDDLRPGHNNQPLGNRYNIRPNQ